MDVEVAIVGAGGAGLSLVLALDRLVSPGHTPSIALVDPVQRAGNDRTWCFWHRGPARSRPPSTGRGRRWRWSTAPAGSGCSRWTRCAT